MSDLAAMFAVMDPDDRRKLQRLVLRYGVANLPMPGSSFMASEDQDILEELVQRYPPLRMGIGNAITQYYGSYAQFLATR